MNVWSSCIEPLAFLFNRMNTGLQFESDYLMRTAYCVMFWKLEIFHMIKVETYCDCVWSSVFVFRILWGKVFQSEWTEHVKLTSSKEEKRSLTEKNWIGGVKSVELVEGHSLPRVISACMWAVTCSAETWAKLSVTTHDGRRPGKLSGNRLRSGRPGKSWTAVLC